MKIYYDHSAGCYYKKVDSGWIRINEGSAVRHIAAHGYSPHVDKNAHLSLAHQELNRIQEQMVVDYAGPLAGWRLGYYNFYGSRVLVTQSPSLITPVEGDWRVIEDCLQCLLGAHPCQVPVIKYWLKVAVENIYLEIRNPGQAVFLIGEGGSGKGFLQNQIITPCFGGRSTPPWLFLSGQTPFNEDLFGNEHLLVEDPDVNTIKDRLDLANRIKQLTVNETQSCHGKHQKAIPLPAKWRTTFSANSEMHNMAVIPYLDASIEDKIILLKCSEKAIPPPAFHRATKPEFLGAVQAAMPGFLWHLTNEVRIPVEWQSLRFGVKHFHHPDLVEMMASQSRESQLLDLIDELRIWEPEPWMGSKDALANRLAMVDSNPDAVAFSKKAASLGHLLNRLASKKYGSRISHLRKGNRWVWRIEKPSPTKN